MNLSTYNFIINDLTNLTTSYDIHAIRRRSIEVVFSDFHAFIWHEVLWFLFLLRGTNNFFRQCIMIISFVQWIGMNLIVLIVWLCQDEEFVRPHLGTCSLQMTMMILWIMMMLLKPQVSSIIYLNYDFHKVKYLHACIYVKVTTR